MAYDYPGEGALDYYPCRYGKSKLLFRGPRRDLERAYVAVLRGGSGKLNSRDKWIFCSTAA